MTMSNNNNQEQDENGNGDLKTINLYVFDHDDHDKITVQTKPTLPSKAAILMSLKTRAFSLLFLLVWILLVVDLFQKLPTSHLGDAHDHPTHHYHHDHDHHVDHNHDDDDNMMHKYPQPLIPFRLQDFLNEPLNVIDPDTAMTNNSNHNDHLPILYYFPAMQDRMGSQIIRMLKLQAFAFFKGYHHDMHASPQSPGSTIVPWPVAVYAGTCIETLDWHALENKCGRGYTTELWQRFHQTRQLIHVLGLSHILGYACPIPAFERTSAMMEASMTITCGTHSNTTTTTTTTTTRRNRMAYNASATMITPQEKEGATTTSTSLQLQRMKTLPFQFLTRPEFSQIAQTFSEEWFSWIRRQSQQERRRQESLLPTDKADDPPDQELYQIAIHIRRGDITPCNEQFGNRYLPNIYYSMVLEKYLPSFCGPSSSAQLRELQVQRRSCRVTIYSENDPPPFEDFDFFRKLPIVQPSDKNNNSINRSSLVFDFESSIPTIWNAMLDADFFILSASSFSFLPSALNHVADRTLIAPPYYLWQKLNANALELLHVTVMGKEDDIWKTTKKAAELVDTKCFA